MKKLITLILLTLSASVMAQHHGHGPRHHGHHRGPGIGWWVAPVVIGAIGYELGRQQTVLVQQPVIVHNPTPYQGQICSQWTETQYSDGTITRTRTCTQ